MTGRGEKVKGIAGKTIEPRLSEPLRSHITVTQTSDNVDIELQGLIVALMCLASLCFYFTFLYHYSFLSNLCHCIFKNI